MQEFYQSKVIRKVLDALARNGYGVRDLDHMVERNVLLVA